MRKKVVLFTVFMVLFSAFLVKVEAKESQDRAEVTVVKQEVKERKNQDETMVKAEKQEVKESKIQESAEAKTEKQEVKENKVQEPAQIKVEKQETKESELKDYIEVNIDKQEISMYLKGKLLVKGPVVTGNVDAGRDTPTGEFSILEKDYDVVLVGPGYASHVTYWMQIYGGIGIHDADEWRDEYGGDIYLSDGSHGCINVPLDIVEIIYKNAYVGMDVIVK